MSRKDLAEITANDWPVELRALPDIKERNFVAAYVENGGCASQAAADAGYLGTNPRSLASIGYRLLQRERVHEAVIAYSKKVLRSLTPKAINVVKSLLDDVTHKDRLKAAQQILDRSDTKVTQIDQTVTVKFDPQRDSIEYLKHLKSLNAPHEMLLAEFGPLGLEHYENLLAKEDAIDAEFVEVTSDGPPNESDATADVDAEFLDL